MRAPLRHVVLALLLAACGGGSGSSADRASAPLEPEVRDSGGVTIYEHPADALDRAPLITIDSVPMVVIGGADLEDDVSHLRGLALLSDGRVTGFDGDLRAVRVFGADGALRASYGRRGEGPGEFRGVDQLVVLPGDSVLAVDRFAERATIIAPDSGIIRMEDVPTRGVGQAFAVAGVLDDGSWLMVPAAIRLLARSARAEPDTSRHPQPIGVHVPGSGRDHFDTLLVQWEAPYRQFQRRMQGRTELAEGPERYAAYPLATGWAGQAAAIPNDCWCVKRYDRTGALRSIVRVPRPRLAITDVLKDSVVALQMERYREALAERPEMARFESLEDAEFNARNTAWADSLSPFAAAPPAQGRVLWLQDATLVFGDSVTYTAVDPEGRLLGRLRLAVTPRVVAFTDDRVILRQEDDDGIVTFAVHRLRMP